MPHLFIETIAKTAPPIDTGDAQRRWTPIEIPGSGVELSFGRFEVQHGRWFFLAHSTTVVLNGADEPWGIIAIDHGDEITVTMSDGSRRRLCFSSEEIVRVEPCAIVGGRCARCDQTIDVDSPAARCVGCRTWFHMTDRLPCFTYAERCHRCDAPTRLSDELQWWPAIPPRVGADRGSDRRSS
ncbi:MAG: hypothetical protein KDC38_05420 [Planctomycetes bacterium]|nr:hypothetical protein [Planctomycetota bacterium]